MSDVLYDDIGPCDECDQIEPRAFIGGALWCRPCRYNY